MVVKKAYKNQLYCKEAIYYYTSDNNSTVYLEMYKNGKKKYGGYNMLVREPLIKGDKVIVIKMKGRAWVYKARD